MTLVGQAFGSLLRNVDKDGRIAKTLNVSLDDIDINDKNDRLSGGLIHVDREKKAGTNCVDWSVVMRKLSCLSLHIDGTATKRECFKKIGKDKTGI